ncbi:MAG: hypothetical protein ACKO5Q_00890, partial [Microcystaceae cyanobacterium]
EALAISRLQDEGHANQWTTLVESGEEIDLEESLAYLKKRGYKVQIPDQNTQSSTQARFDRITR